MNYDELVKALRDDNACLSVKTLHEAADAIEELLKAAKAMHTWIFLNSFDEQEAYDECHLTDEMNVALGYGGKWELRATPPNEGEG